MLAWIQSDEQGLWGRECPDCGCYFRSNHIMGATFCPYCGKVQDSLEYVTDAQAKYVETFCQSVNRAFADKKTITLDAAEVTDEPPPWQYTETKQQFHFDCGHCHARTDILGDYGFCPSCGRTNGDKLIEQRLTSLQERLEKADRSLNDKRQRGEEWERLTIACFEAFEPLGNHLRQVLALVPATPKRRAEIQNLNFQRIFETATKLEQWFGIELLGGISENDRGLLRKMLQRRHVLTHNGGKVDQGYLDSSGDVSVKLNERHPHQEQ
jgi:uncharacterized Zn finger protein (UPF0148 family)